MGTVDDACCRGKMIDRITFSINFASYSPKVQKFDSRDHIIVPVVMLTEGVHNGSDGPIYYPAEEISKFPVAWNGVPVPVYHPEHAGFPISCNAPDVLDAQNIGRVFSAQSVEGGKKLKAELWLDIEKMQKIAPDVLTLINSKKMVEVSTGLFFEAEMKDGEWNGEKYYAIARNFIPDHLAILPSGVGACSSADGCGIRANASIEVKETREYKTNNNKNTGGKTVERQQKIDLLTTNGISFENDVWETLSDTVLDAMIGQEEKMTQLNASIVSLQEETTALKANLEKNPASPEEFISQAPVDIQATLNRALARDRQMKRELVTTLTKNQAVFSALELEAKSLEELEKLATLACPKDFSLRGGATVTDNAVKEEPLGVPVLQFKK